ncbi:MAG: hypothetical protein IKN49_02430 [Elusimicrobiaceae bacterium]|nr:hypothetical protein [Elusimicrobiaceae bacterium]
MKFFHQYGKLIGLFALSLLCLAGVFSRTIEENMLALVPQSIRRQVALFERSPLSQKLIVIVTSASAAQTTQISQDLQEKLTQAGFIKPWSLPTEDVVQTMLTALPACFSVQVQQIAQQKLSPSSVDAQLADYYEKLFSFQSVFVSHLITHDPFYLTEILFDKWATIGNNGPNTYENGLLANQEGTVQAGLYDTKDTVSDLRAAHRLQKFFTDYQFSLSDGARAFFMGGLRYTLENASLIKRDLTMITWVGLTCLSVIFLWLFRTKRALLIYALALLVLPPAALATQLVFGHISGITLGFGSVVAGLSVDYAIYVYFALQQTQLDTVNALAQVRKHVRCNFLTSALCFVALFFSSVEVFKQIAVFALVALTLALWISLHIFPSYFSKQMAPKGKTVSLTVKPFTFQVACLVSLLLLIFGLWGVTHVSFSQELDSLNSTSTDFKRDKSVADELFSSDQNALLFALGSTQDEALANNEKLSARSPRPLPVSELFVSHQTQLQNEARWQEFWNVSHRNDARLLLREEAQKKGFQSNSFLPFWQWLDQTMVHAPSVDFSAWYNPVLTLSKNLYAVVNIVPNDPLYAKIADGKNTFFVSTLQLQKDLVQGVKKEALRVVCLALLFNWIAVWMLFKNFKETLLCFVPVVLGGCILFGCLAVFDVQVNLFGLIFLPLLIGLGIDYAIFQLMKFHSQETPPHLLYPTKALLAAGLSTLAGFGVLVLAKHAVLCMMGLCALLGIGGAIGVALWILPAFKEQKI